MRVATSVRRMREKNQTQTLRRAKSIAFMRIAFGIVWLIDAYFKWQPGVFNNIVDILKGALDGQPAFVQTWINAWVNLVSIDPHLFALLIALSETGIAIGLILGLFSNLVYAGGALLSLLIWAVAEGFGGPYTSGASDIGTGIIYVFVFLGLFLLSAGQYYGLDGILRAKRNNKHVQ